jgi:hypothetical protein
MGKAPLTSLAQFSRKSDGGRNLSGTLDDSSRVTTKKEPIMNKVRLGRYGVYHAGTSLALAAVLAIAAFLLAGCVESTSGAPKNLGKDGRVTRVERDRARS